MGMDRHQWHCGEAGHHRPPRPGTCTEVVNVWLFPKLCPPAMQTGSCTHGARRCRRGRPVLTTHRVIGWGLSPGPAPPPAAVHPPAGCWMSLDQGPQPVALTWPGHRPCVGLYVHLCTWGVQGLQGISVRVAASSCPHVRGPWGRREVCVCVWCTRLSVWQGDPCQGVHGDPGMFARVSVIVPGVHACGECIHVCRSFSVWNVWCLQVYVHICT